MGNRMKRLFLIAALFMAVVAFTASTVNLGPTIPPDYWCGEAGHDPCPTS